MPRRPRILVPDHPLHIVQRGINREPCFFAEADYQCYLHWLEEAARDCGCAMRAYALMTNHVHLLLTPARPGASARLMQSLCLSLDVEPASCRDAYRALFRPQLDADPASDVRETLKLGMPQGSERFAEAVCARLGIRRNTGKRGRAPGAERKSESALIEQQEFGF
ncbi:MAG: transposase [Sulfuritalea sp.]|nr:transposase [Sulfuritalea sp.]